MRLLAILVVLAVVGVLGARAIHPSSKGVDTAPAAQQVVNQARSDIQRAEATNQAKLQQSLNGADGQ
jgi:type II secretory pathway pseudopilin PulG